MAGRGRPSRASVYERLGLALAELDERFGGLPSPKEAESIWADIWGDDPSLGRDAASVQVELLLP